MEHILLYQFFQNALWTALLTSIVCGVIGAYIVVRRIVFISGGITHASFGGLGLGVYLGLNPILMAGVAAVGAALGISSLSKGGDIREDSAIASVWALGMALGVLFISLTPGYATSLTSYLFGNILLVTRADLVALLIVAIGLIYLFVAHYRVILYTVFDSDFAQTRGVSAHRWNSFMLIVVAICLVLSIRTVGIMLLMSLLTLPQSTMSLFTSDFRKIIVGSVVLSLVANVSGLFLSTVLRSSVSPGVIVVLLLFGILGVARLLRFIGSHC